ncbi:O-antigen ligase family protein [Microvirga sp. 2YAF29]|uniref:O-antigen ligase family protein n=1 Tax=Microvirga sp. 2YAF29 TaxID=3233031 RepID=UPI003F9D7A6C
MVTLALIPAGMVIANRSSATLIVLSAIFALAATGIEGRARPLWRDIVSAMTSPIGLAALIFFLWCAVSISWSEFKLVSLRSFGEFWVPIGATLVLGLTLAPRLTRRMFLVLTAVYVVSCLDIALELATHRSLRAWAGARSDPFIFNRPILTLLMMTPPLVAWLLGSSRRGLLYALGLTALLGFTAMRSESDAAALGLIIVCLAFPLAWFFPRMTCILAALAFMIAMAVSPLIGQISSQVITPEMHKKIATGHSKERVALWSSFGSAVREDPILGGGFGVSPKMAETTVASKVPRKERKMLAIGHPHNAALQIWVELGAVGAVLALAVVFLTLRAVARHPHLVRSASLGIIAGAAPVALVGHGAWQGWWAASLGAAMIWTLAAARFQTESR